MTKYPEQYPEHEKLSKVKDQTQAIGAFLDNGGLGTDVVLARWGIGGRYGGDPDRLYSVPLDIQQLLADYFHIDRDKLEAEKRQMLEEIRYAATEASTDEHPTS